MYVDYFWYADRFGWTPDQVDALPIEVATRLKPIAELYDEVVADKQRRAERG